VDHPEVLAMYREAVERLCRDNRLNAIHEGTHGIQGLDLLGRKVSMQGGRALELLSARVHETLAEAQTSSQLSAQAAELRASCHELAEVTRRLVDAAGRNPELGLANATVYLDAFGHIVVAWLWLRQALVALHAQAGALEADQDFYAGKLAACRFFFIHELPKARERLQMLARLDDTTLAITEAAF
jgi:butyryl-CoA dehydrogenase